MSKSIVDDTIQNENIIWFDYTPNILKFYLQSSIVCLPSYREGLSQSLIEASSCGCPIVTTDVPGCKDVVIHNKTGFIVPDRNVKLLTKYLQILMTDKNKREYFANNARKYAIENFDEKIILKQFKKIYEKI